VIAASSARASAHHDGLGEDEPAGTVEIAAHPRDDQMLRDRSAGIAAALEILFSVEIWPGMQAKCRGKGRPRTHAGRVFITLRQPGSAELV
jgi:hypothetical protein